MLGIGLPPTRLNLFALLQHLGFLLAQDMASPFEIVLRLDVGMVVVFHFLELGINGLDHGHVLLVFVGRVLTLQI